MMLPGFPRPMVSGKSMAAPFSLSGSWENNADGWSLPDTNFVVGLARTGTYAVQRPSGSVGTTLTYVVPASVCAGLMITASVFARTRLSGPATSATILIRLSDNSESSASGSYPMETYSLLTTSKENVTYGDVTVEIYIERRNSFEFTIVDDWSIVGMIP